VNQSSRTGKAVITPPVDAVCGGGLSLAVAALVIAYGWITEAGMQQMLLAIQLYLLTDLLINGPHFVASYRLLYSNPKNFRNHPLVTIGFPILAVAFLAYVTYLLQAFHALQYLTFPIRVEINEYTHPGHKWRHLIAYYVILVVIGLFAFEWTALFRVSDARLQLGTATMMVINIHHYFIDAVIWKIRDPEVRRSLLGHLPPAGG
jgi:hypothetical protein